MSSYRGRWDTEIVSDEEIIIELSVILYIFILELLTTVN